MVRAVSIDISARAVKTTIGNRWTIHVFFVMTLAVDIGQTWWSSRDEIWTDGRAHAQGLFANFVFADP